MNVKLAIARSKDEILEDMYAGRVPATVATFSELHDYVDANEYGGLCEDVHPASYQEAAEANAVQSAVDAWLRAGLPGEVVNGCEVIYANGTAVVIHHPAGYMIYAGWRVATLRTLAGAIRRADREAAR